MQTSKCWSFVGDICLVELSIVPTDIRVLWVITLGVVIWKLWKMHRERGTSRNIRMGYLEEGKGEQEVNIVPVVTDERTSSPVSPGLGKSRGE